MDTTPTAARESFPDQLSRVGLMADGHPTWDLSDNDRAALEALLVSHDGLLKALKHLIRYDFGESNGAKEARAAIAKAEGR